MEIVHGGVEYAEFHNNSQKLTKVRWNFVYVMLQVFKLSKDVGCYNRL